MIYFDACYIAKLYVPEQDSSAIKAAVEADGLLACSMQGQTEVFSVFHRKLREKAITAEEFDALCLQFETEAPTSKYLWLPLNAAVLHCAADHFKSLPATTFIRAADALHLAAAKDKGFTAIHSSDKHLLVAAPHFGLTGIAIQPLPPPLP